jgi:hypothetical protein
MTQANRKKSTAGGDSMTQQENKEEENAAKKDAGTIRIRWDDSGMKTSYANVCNVSSTREEVTILFGTNQTWQTGQNELVVQLTDRIILNAYAAKRLSVLLNRVVADYEARFGELDLDLGR